MNKNPNGTARKEIVIRKISSNGENGWLGQVTKSSIELEDAAARFRELYDFAPNGYVSFDRSGRIVEANLTAAHLIGLPRERLVGMPFAVFVWREDTPLFLHHLLRCRSSDTRVETELRLKNIKRQIIYAQLVTIPIVKSLIDGGTAFQTSIVDLTERKLSEEALQEKEAELELIITRTPFMLTRCTRDLRYQYVSRAYAEMLGRPQEDIAGEPIVHIMGKKALAAIGPYVERVLSGETVTYEAIVPFKDAGPHFLSVTYVPDKNEQGEVIGWVASMVDIGERKKAEERFRIAVEASPSGMLMVDRDRRITLVNSQAERLFGYRREELLGESVEMLMPERLRRQVPMIAEPKTLGVSRDLFGLRKDGIEVPVEVRLNPIRIGGHRFVLVSVIDTTERKKAQEKIDANMKALMQLHQLGEFCALPRNSMQRSLEKILEAAITIGNADKGNIQIVNQQSGGLEIAVHSGFAKPFLRFFRDVKGDDASACAAAMREAKYTIVDDVTKSEIFAGQPSRRILLAAGVRAIHSVPLVSTSGNLVGILSVHFSKPHWPQQRDLGFMDLLARQAADYIERKQAERALAEVARQQTALYLLARRWQSAKSLEDVYNAALNAITSALNSDRASILLYDDQQVMRFVASRGLSAAYRKAVEGHSPWKWSTKNPKPIQIADTRLADISTLLKRSIRREGIRAAAFIPLVIEDQLIGKFMVYYRLPHVFTNDEIDLAMNLARQLAQAIHRQKNEEELRQRERDLARELVDQRKLQEISGRLIKQRNVKAVYMQIMKATMTLLRSEFGSLQMVIPKTGELLLLAHKGFVSRSASAWYRIGPKDGGTSCAEALRRGERVIVPDIEQCRFLKEKDVILYRQSGIRSMQSTPLISRSGGLVGMISTHWQDVYEPSKRELRLLDVMARQAADLIEWKHADDEVRESEARMRATVEQATAGMARCDPSGRFIFVNRRLCQMLGYTELELLGKTIDEVTHRDDVDENMRLFRRMINNGKPFEIEKRYIRKDGSVLWADVSASAVRRVGGKIQSTVAVIVDVTDRKKAEMALQKSHELLEERVRDRTRELNTVNTELNTVNTELNTVNTELNTVNNRLNDEIERRKGLEGEILSVSDREQQRLGQELHDGLCQHLTAVAFMTRSIALRLRNHRVVDADDIEKIADLVNKAAVDTRNLSRALHRVDVDAAGLVAALQDLVDREIWKTPCRLELKRSFQINSDVAAAHLYRIAREAVINANKHARAHQIIVRLERLQQEMVLRVIDDGVGFPKNLKPQQGLGYHIMKYRAQLIGARLEINSPRTGGTRLSCYVPVYASRSHKSQNGDRAAAAISKLRMPVAGDRFLRHLAQRGAANAIKEDKQRLDSRP
jgi:PAS domain S-box-containing protein